RERAPSSISRLFPAFAPPARQPVIANAGSRLFPAPIIWRKQSKNGAYLGFGRYSWIKNKLPWGVRARYIACVENKQPHETGRMRNGEGGQGRRGRAGAWARLPTGAGNPCSGPNDPPS